MPATAGHEGAARGHELHSDWLGQEGDAQRYVCVTIRCAVLDIQTKLIDGFGHGGAGSAPYEPTINEVVVPVLSRSECVEWHMNVHVNVTDGMMCAGYSEGGKDACQVSA